MARRCVGQPGAAGILGNGERIEGVAPPCQVPPGTGRRRRATGRHRGPADPVEAKIAGAARNAGNARSPGRPGEQLILAGQGGDGGQRIAEQALFEEAAELAQQGEQADARRP
jgi:hypothetical protein